MKYLSITLSIIVFLVILIPLTFSAKLLSVKVISLDTYLRDQFPPEWQLGSDSLSAVFVNLFVFFIHTILFILPPIAIGIIAANELPKMAPKWTIWEGIATKAGLILGGAGFYIGFAIFTFYCWDPQFDVVIISQRQHIFRAIPSIMMGLTVIGTITLLIVSDLWD